MAFEPVIELTDLNRGELAQTCATPGYKVIHKILRNVVDTYVTKHLNTAVENKEAAYASFVQTKTAAQIYQGMTDRINAEIAAAVAKSTDTGVEGDVTETVLDIGEVASLPNLLGDVQDDVLEGTQ
jgi:hypothetical protein